MNTIHIAGAVTWQYGRFLVWPLAQLLALAIAGPIAVAWLLGFPQSFQGVDAGFPIAEFHLVFLALGFLAFSAAAIGAEMREHARLFVLPVSTRFLVTLQAVLGGSAVALATCATLFCYRSYFRLDWPVLVPAVLMFVGYGWFRLGIWQLLPLQQADCLAREFMGLRLSRVTAFLATRLTAGILCLLLFGAWAAWHYDRGAASEPLRLWDSLSALDLLVLVVAGGIAWWLTVLEVERQRHGDRLGVVLNMLPGERATSMTKGQPFGGFHAEVPADRSRALRWYLWHTGRPLAWPLSLVFGGMILAVVLLVLGEPDGKLLDGLSAVVILHPVLGALLIGMVAGQDLADVGRRAMKTFVAAHAIGDRDLARSLLHNLLKTTTVFWIANAAAAVLPVVLVLTFNLDRREAELQHSQFSQWGFWSLPLILGCSYIAAWTVAGLTGSLAWTGRPRLGAAVFLTLCVGGVLSVVAFKYSLPPQSAAEVQRWAGHVAAGLTVVGTAWAFAAGVRRRLLNARDVAAAFLIWALLAPLLWIFAPASPAAKIDGSALLLLVVLPVAAAPLAVAWDRHR